MVAIEIARFGGPEVLVPVERRNRNRPLARCRSRLPSTFCVGKRISRLQDFTIFLSDNGGLYAAFRVNTLGVAPRGMVFVPVARGPARDYCPDIELSQGLRRPKVLAD